MAAAKKTSSKLMVVNVPPNFISSKINKCMAKFILDCRVYKIVSSSVAIDARIFS